MKQFNTKEYELIRYNADKAGLLTELDKRYKVNVNWVAFNSDTTFTEVSIGLRNPDTLDYIILDGVLTSSEKLYKFLVEDTNNPYVNDDDTYVENHIIEKFSKELKEKFEAKLDIIYHLMTVEK